jgi:hypothetical protein
MGAVTPQEQEARLTLEREADLLKVTWILADRLDAALAAVPARYRPLISDALLQIALDHRRTAPTGPHIS